MNDHELDLLLYRANPNRRPESGVDVELALDELFDEIVATSRLRGVRPGDARRLAGGRRRPTRTVVTSVAAAAVVVVGALGLAASRDRDPNPGVSSGSTVASSTTPTAEDGMSFGSPPMVLLDDTWEIGYLNESPDGSSGLLTLRAIGTESDPGEVSSSVLVGWSREQTDPSGVAVEQEPTTVFGLPARVFASVRAPNGESFYIVLVDLPDAELSVETGAVPDRVGLDALLATLHQVDVDTFEAALPDTVITPAQREAAANQMLAGIPRPPSFNIGDLVSQRTYTDRDQLGIQVAGRVVCGWTDAWFSAQEIGDTEAADAAAAAMASSRQWPVLLAMPEGGLQDNIWAYADAINGDGFYGPAPLTRADVASIFECGWPELAGTQTTAVLGGMPSTAPTAVPGPP